MNGFVRNLATVAGLAVAASGSVNAAPISPSERTDVKSMQRHEWRDVQTGDYRPHGALTRQQSESRARGAAKKTAPQTTMPDKNYPY